MLLEIDGTLLYVFVSFCVFVFLMNLICYKPITLLIKKREKLLYKNKETIENTNGKKAEVIDTIKRELQGAKFESSKLLKAASENNRKEKDEAIKTRKNEIFDDIEEYENQISDSSKNTKNLLKNEVQNYVKTAVARVLSMNPDEIKVDEAKIDEIIK